MIKIAVDGPGGAGKSSLARAVARTLGYIYVDTGALYRAVGLYMYRHGVDPRDGAAVVRMLPGVKLDLVFRDGEQYVELCGETVGEELRRPEISMYASAVSALQPVRDMLLGTQRRIADRCNVVMDGRDIGTVIFPDAQAKIFLTASSEVRARRRYEELKAKGLETTYQNVLDEMNARDRSDRTRAIAPAVPAEDATVLDNSLLDENGTLAAALEIIKNCGIVNTGSRGK